MLAVPGKLKKPLRKGGGGFWAMKAKIVNGAGGKIIARHGDSSDDE